MTITAYVIKDEKNRFGSFYGGKMLFLLSGGDIYANEDDADQLCAYAKDEGQNCRVVEVKIGA